MLFIMDLMIPPSNIPQHKVVVEQEIISDGQRKKHSDRSESQLRYKWDLTVFSSPTYAIQVLKGWKNIYI